MTEVRAAAQSGFIAPTIDIESEPWWAALAEKRLLLPRSLSCGRYWFPPTPGCPYCGSTEYKLREASGKGSLYSWVVVNRALHPLFGPDAPYTIALVQLEEGPRIFGRLFLRPGTGPVAGLPLQAVYYRVGESTLVGFEPARD